MNDHLSNRQYRGFSLLEFVAVLIIVGALSVALVPRFSSNYSALLSAKNDVVIALQTARQIALARTDASTVPLSSIRFVATLDSISVLEGNRAILLSDKRYPLSLPEGITITQGFGTHIFDHLGNTSPSTLEISDGLNRERITINELGFIQ